MKTVTKNNGRTTSPSRIYNPWDRHFRNDFLDFWDEDINAETIPSINISEEKDRYKVEMAAPGLKKEDFNIEVDGNIMTISSESESETKDGDRKEEGGYWRREYNYSRFSRSFTLPEHAETDDITAKYTDGVLALSIPKKHDVGKNTNHKIKVQ